MTYDELLDKWLRKLGRPCTAGEIVHDLRQLELPVRCKDCKLMSECFPSGGHLVNGKLWCAWWNNITEPEVFCSMGERREDGKE